MIFDLSRFILGDDPVIEVSAYGSQLISAECKEVGDQDTAMFIMRSQKGVLIHINNSRRAVYGYDQRVEIFGSKGMMISNNQSPTSVEKFDNNMTYAKDPIHFFFIERYEQAYKDQLGDFVDIVMNNEKTYRLHLKMVETRYFLQTPPTNLLRPVNQPKLIIN